MLNHIFICVSNIESTIKTFHQRTIKNKKLVTENVTKTRLFIEFYKTEIKIKIN